MTARRYSVNHSLSKDHRPKGRTYFAGGVFLGLAAAAFLGFAAAALVVFAAGTLAAFASWRFSS